MFMRAGGQLASELYLGLRQWRALFLLIWFSHGHGSLEDTCFLLFSFCLGVFAIVGVTVHIHETRSSCTGHDCLMVHC